MLHWDDAGLSRDNTREKKPAGATKYQWTPELRARLQEAYREGSKVSISNGLDRLQRLTGWPRSAFKSEACRLGLVSFEAHRRRPWTKAELSFLATVSKNESIKSIARRLGRSHASVAAKLSAPPAPAAVSGGYTTADLVSIFGVGRDRVRRWVDAGMLGRVARGQADSLIPPDCVARFVKQHPGEYDLRKVNQSWFKAVIFSSASEESGGMSDGRFER